MNQDPRESSLSDSEHMLEDLGAPMACPDMTRRIMGQLGYMKTNPNVVRRRRFRRGLQRAGLVGAAMCAMAFGAYLFIQSPEARTPQGPTIREAVSNDIQQHQKQIDNVIQTIQQLSPALLFENLIPDEPMMDLPSNEEELPMFAMAPYCWI